MTAVAYGPQIGRHENRTPTVIKNRNSQVHGDSGISSGGEFEEVGEWDPLSGGSRSKPDFGGLKGAVTIPG